MIVINKFFICVNKWFRPYWNPKPPKPKNNKKVVKKVNKSDDVKRAIIMNKELIMPVLPYPKPLDKAINFKKKPSPNKIWYFHDSNKHQIFAYLPKGSGYLNDKGRSDSERRKLKPLIYPLDNGRFDRTHILPIGYHGSENDKRLVIGWDSEQNRNELNKFEQRNKARKEDIYWLTSIERTDFGARWIYKVYSVNTLELLDSLSITMICKFKWFV